MREPRASALPEAPRAPSWLPLALGLGFALQCVAAGLFPHDRGDWLLENLIAIPVAVWLVAARRRLPLSSTSWVLVFVFLALHEIGSHYTYSRVPWIGWLEELVGRAPSWERNHYDRFVHFAFGLLLVAPIRQLLAAVVDARPLLLRLLALCVVATLSSLYELAEWAAALVVDPELGIAFVGAQGDIWDAQKDMALALGGAFIATLLDATRQHLAGPGRLRGSEPGEAQEEG